MARAPCCSACPTHLPPCLTEYLDLPKRRRRRQAVDADGRRQLHPGSVCSASPPRVKAAGVQAPDSPLRPSWPPLAAQDFTGRGGVQASQVDCGDKTTDRPAPWNCQSPWIQLFVASLVLSKLLLYARRLDRGKPNSTAPHIPIHPVASFHLPSFCHHQY